MDDRNKLSDLIEALQIFLKYGNPLYPTHCEHDILLMHPDCSSAEISDDDKTRLEDLGFHESTEFECWASYRFGSG